MTTAAEVIRASPTFGVLCFLGLFWFIYRQQIKRLLTDMSQVELFGVKLLASHALFSASERAKRSGIRAISPNRQKETIDLLEKYQNDIRNAEILWVDDHPYNCFDEARVLQSFGIIVSFVTKSFEAMDILLNGSGFARVDVVITDIDRSDSGDGSEAGLELVRDLSANEVGVPVIIYTGARRQVSPPVYGLTNVPDELIRMVVSAILGRHKPDRAL